LAPTGAFPVREREREREEKEVGEVVRHYMGARNFISVFEVPRQCQLVLLV
jgi:hypothetical protein